MSHESDSSIWSWFADRLGIIIAMCLFFVIIYLISEPELTEKIGKGILLVLFAINALIVLFSAWTIIEDAKETMAGIALIGFFVLGPFFTVAYFFHVQYFYFLRWSEIDPVAVWASFFIQTAIAIIADIVIAFIFGGIIFPFKWMVTMIIRKT